MIVDDQEVPVLSRRELYRLRARIGYVFQFAALFDSLTIGENVAMGLRKQGELTEASGGITEATAAEIAPTGVDMRARYSANSG